MSRTYLVTGVASGIGKATAEKLRGLGHRVIGVDLHDADIEVDLTTANGRTQLVDRVTELSGGQLDGVMAIAGIAAPIAATVKVNYFGALATLEAARPLLESSAAPRAVVVASLASIQPHDDELVDLLLAGDESSAVARAEVLAGGENENHIYASTKRAIARWIRTASVTPEWAGAGIALNGVAPGVVLTPMTEYLRESPEALAQLMEIVPMPFNGPVEPDEVADLLVWLGAAENKHVTGQVVFIDGGYDAFTRGDSTW